MALAWLSNAKVNAMLDSLSPDMPETIRYLAKDQAQDRRRPSSSSAAPPVRARGRRRNRQMREKRTAYIMMAFGLLLGALELYIVLSYF
jgi:hypothetical protein